MVKINIKIEDLFEKLSLNTNPTKENPEITFVPPEIIKIKTPQGEYKPIKKFIKKLVDSYKIWFSNGFELICSDNHILLTDKGEKKIKEINETDNIIILNEDGQKENLKLEEYSLHKKNDILYDISIDYPHLFVDTNGLVHHNSLILSYIINILLNRKEIEKGIIIVPNLNLVEQFYDDMKKYGITHNIGRVNKDKKEFDNPIVISTWQSLQRRKEELKSFQCVMTDECHHNSAQTISEVLKCCKNAKYRIGCTGTMPSESLSYYQVISYIGPVLVEYTSDTLAQEGFISPCKVNTIYVKHPYVYTGEYQEIKDNVFRNESRMNLIKRIAENCDDSILMLVNKVENEGELLRDYLKSCSELQNKTIVFISGKVGSKEREYWRRQMNEKENIILIATYQIFSTGINIPKLKYVLFASPLKSKIKVLQSIGRSLRKYADKDGAIIYDLIDKCKHLQKHGNSRIRHYNSENFEIEESQVKL